MEPRFKDPLEMTPEERECRILKLLSYGLGSLADELQRAEASGNRRRKALIVRGKEGTQ